MNRSQQESRRRRPHRAILSAAVLAGVSACSGVEPMKFRAADEIPPGPGLLSGEDGVFVLYRNNRAGNDE